MVAGASLETLRQFSLLRTTSLSLRARVTTRSSSPGALSRVFSACSRQAKT